MNTNTTLLMNVPFTEQTFTAGETGKLDKVSIYLGCCYTGGFPQDMETPSPLYLEVEGTQSDPIGNWYFQGPQYFGPLSWVDVPLNPAPFVEAGKQYRFQLSTDVASSAMYQLGFANSDVYSGGEWRYSWDGIQWTNDRRTWDLAFKTYVTPEADTTPPEVSSTSPSKNATGVAATANISATFLESGSGIDPNTLTTDTFKVVQVKPTGNLPVSGTLSYDEASKTATFTPSSNLGKGLYHATITTEVKDKAGNALANAYTWQFATAGPPSRR